MKKKSLLALAALPVAFLTTGCLPGQGVPNIGGGAPAGPAPTTVTKIVDGDTVDLSTGERVRFIGIDTPERGQCGFNEASAAMRHLVLGQTVNVVSAPGREDRDGYGRILRYVETADYDAGRLMVENGWAHARYDGIDSRSFQTHPRRDDYRALDAAHAAPACGW